ncbi:MAG: DUF1566 domain-containing protein [Flavobacteriales bacterium]|nr:DUF1566 domain-containing protein [Flavobacteriales bacterium]
MKKLLLILLCLPLLFSTCKKEEEELFSSDLENTIVGKEWSLTNGNGFLMAEDGKFYLTEECQPNTRFGNWEIILDSIYPTLQYKYSSNSQEITTILGEVTEYSESEIKLLSYTSTSTSVIKTYILDMIDIYGCTDATQFNYDPNATCDDGSCSPFVNGCTDLAAINYNALANTDDGSCCYNGDICMGSLYQGGIIFYLDGNGGGLMAAPSDQGYVAWGCQGTLIGTTGSAIGTGNQNTIDIEAGCTSTGTAADICANLTLEGHSDWFLPSKDELNLMRSNIYGDGNIGGFNNGTGYWCSTEKGHSSAYMIYFNTGSVISQAKNNNYKVRAMRTF